MSKYDKLADELRRSGLSTVEMTFQQIESIIGPLPESARRYQEWWANTPTNSQSSKGWLPAGHVVDKADLDGAVVRFARRPPVPRGARRTENALPDTDVPTFGNTAASKRGEGDDSIQENLKRLMAAGFARVGYWTFKGDALSFDLDETGDRHNILYAFVVDGDVRYVGKSTKTLRFRMASYKNPGPTQKTNIANNARIREHLARGEAVDIYALVDSGLFQYAGFHLNMAAGLEDGIISALNPEWNGTARIHEGR